MNTFYVVEGVEEAGIVYLGFDDEGSRLAYLQGAYLYNDKDEAVYDCEKAKREFKGVVFKVRVCKHTLGGEVM